MTPSSGNSETSSAANLPLTALTAIAGGIGGLGFFTFVGGAITISRLRGAGVSGTSAVARVPKVDLFVLGVDALLLPILAALLVALIFVFALDLNWDSGKWVLAVSAAFGIGYFAWRMNYWQPVSRWSNQTTSAFFILVVVALCGVPAVWALAQRARKAAPERDDARARATTARSRAPHRRAKVRATAAELNPVRRGPESLVPAGALLFMAAAIFVAAGEYALGYVHPQIHPAAVARKAGKPPVSGIYVGDSDNRIWIAKVHPDPRQPDLGAGGGYLVGIPRSEVSEVLVGRSERLHSVIRHEQCLLSELAAISAPEPRC